MAGEGADDRPPPEPGASDEGFRWGASWFAPVPAVSGYWVEISDSGKAAADRIAPLLSQLLGGETDSLALVQQLADRYEEIELLYSISETLGGAIGLGEATRTIVREVATVVGARRASILVHDAKADVLRPVAGWGIDVESFDPIEVGDDCSIAARVFREQRIIRYDPRSGEEPPPCEPGRAYRGAAFLSVPIVHARPNETPQPIGVLNVTDRTGTDAFSENEMRLLAAVANQVGASIENARLLERDRRRQRMSREMELAHDLQLKLLRPRPIKGVDLAARCLPAESVGGDFYNVLQLSDHRVGVMLGDVSSHGFAAGIHAEEAASPDEALRQLLDSVGEELEETEMFLTIFYGVADTVHGCVRYANAGHPHAFRIDVDGSATRLGATSAPLGLAPRDKIAGADGPWTRAEDTLLLFSDGVADAQDESGERFGEDRVLSLVVKHRREGPEATVDAVLSALEAYQAGTRDDRTILVFNA